MPPTFTETNVFEAGALCVTNPSLAKINTAAESVAFLFSVMWLESLEPGEMDKIAAKCTSVEVGVCYQLT